MRGDSGALRRAQGPRDASAGVQRRRIWRNSGKTACGGAPVRYAARSISQEIEPMGIHPSKQRRTFTLQHETLSVLDQVSGYLRCNASEALELGLQHGMPALERAWKALEQGDSRPLLELRYG